MPLLTAPFIDPFGETPGIKCATQQSEAPRAAQHAMRPAPARPDATALLSELHVQYERAVRYPHLLHRHARAPERIDDRAPAESDSNQHLGLAHLNAMTADRLMFDMHDLSAAFGPLDTCAAPDLAFRHDVPEILALFAAPATPLSADGWSNAVLPDLARREHRHVSPDSPLVVNRSRPDCLSGSVDQSTRCASASDALPETTHVPR